MKYIRIIHTFLKIVHSTKHSFVDNSEKQIHNNQLNETK